MSEEELRKMDAQAIDLLTQLCAAPFVRLSLDEHANLQRALAHISERLMNLGHISHNQGESLKAEE